MLCIAQVISTIDRGMLALVVDPVRRDLGITDLQIAILQGFAFSFLYVIAGIAMGLVADVANRKRLLMAGIAVWSAATLASGLAESFGQLFAARLFIGIGEAVLAPCAVTMIAVFYWGPALLARVFDYPVDEVSKMLGLGHIAWAVAGAATAGFVTDRVARRKGAVGLIGVAAAVSLLDIPASLAVFAGSATTPAS